jgi:YfiH family protein
MLKFDIFPPGVTALTITNETDFSFPFSDVQKKFLSDIIGDVPGLWEMKQVHGSRVIVCGESEKLNGSRCEQGQIEADAAVCGIKGFALAVRTADCLPIFYFDKRSEAVGIAHAGWKGTAEKIAVKTLDAMRKEFGSVPSDIVCALGPAIRSCCYQVGPEFRDRFPSSVVQKGEVVHFDLPGENFRQLTEAGVLKENIRDCGKCTCCGVDYFSYRRDGANAGRMLSLILIK